MANKKNKGKQGRRPAEGKSAPSVKTAPKGAARRLSLRMRIILIALLVALFVSAAIGGFFIYRAHAGFNYMEADLSRYVSISAEDIKNISLAVKVDKPTEEDLERELLALRVKYKTLILGSAADDIIAEGSVVSIFYAGYLIGKDGGREYFSGGSNLSNVAGGSPHQLTIGEGGFIPGFEQGLIGIRPSDTEIPEVITTGTIAEGDVVYANIVGYHPNGTAINLSGQPLVVSPELDAQYGVGFYELLLGQTVGKRIIKENTILKSAENPADEFLYTSMTTQFKTVGGKAHTVEGYFPVDYKEGSFLNGKTAYFEVYIKDTTSYTVPEFTDAFLTEKVGIVSAELEDYEGETLAEKYRDFVWKNLCEDYESRLFTASEESFWKKIVEVATVKRIPGAATNEIYDEYMDSLRVTYQDYLDSMGMTEAEYSFQTFTSEYFTLEEGMSYKTYVRKVAEQTAKEKMIFFYAIQVMNVAPSESELQAEFKDSLRELAKQSSLLDESYYNDIEDPAEREEAYEKYMEELEKTEATLLENAGEEYFLESAYYNLGFPRLLEKAKITFVGKGHS